MAKKSMLEREKKRLRLVIKYGPRRKNVRVGKSYRYKNGQ